MSAENAGKSKQQEVKPIKCSKVTKWSVFMGGYNEMV